MNLVLVITIDVIGRIEWTNPFNRLIDFNDNWEELWHFEAEMQAYDGGHSEHSRAFFEGRPEGKS